MPVWTPEIEVSEAVARRLVSTQFPEFGQAGFRWLGQGWDNVAWLLDERCVFRFPQRRLGAQCMESEIHVLPRLAERVNFALTAPRWIGIPQDEYPWHFAGYPLLPGRPVCDVTLTATQRSRLAEELAPALLQLHSINRATAESWGAPPDTLRRLDVDVRLQRADEQLHRAAQLGLLGDIRPWMELLEEIRRDRPIAESRCLVHGDLYARHVLVDTDGRFSGLIDWGDVHCSHPAIDLGLIWSLFERADRNRFLAIYGPIDAVTERLIELRVVNHASICLLYAHETSDAALFDNSRTALHRLLRERA